VTAKDNPRRKDREVRGGRSADSPSLALQINTVMASMIAMYTATKSLLVTVVSEAVVLVVVVVFLLTRRSVNHSEQGGTSDTVAADRASMERENPTTYPTTDAANDGDSDLGQ
jgi:hypothetical protein